MEATSLRFWGIMSLASLVGGILAIPINWWLVKNKLKHGMGTERALGKGGEKPHIEQMKMVAMLNHSGHNMQMEKDANTNMAGMNMESPVHVNQKILMAFLSVVALAIGIFLAAYFGDFSMKPKGEMNNMEMKR